MPGRGGQVDVGLARRPGVARGSTQSSAGGSGPRRRSSIRVHSTVWRLGDVVPVERDRVAVVDVGVRRRAGRRCRSSPSAPPRRSRCTAACCHPCAACRCPPCRSRRACSTPRGTAGRWCRSRTGPSRRARSSNSRERVDDAPHRRVPVGLDAARRPRAPAAGSAGQARGWPASRRGPSGPSRPRLTRSPARPRTPTIRPPRTAKSIASPLECSIEAVCDPALDVGCGDPVGQVQVDPLRPRLAGGVGRALAPGIGDPVGNLVGHSANGLPRGRRGNRV